MGVVFFPVGGGISAEGARAIEARYGDLDRFDAWLARLQAGLVPPDEMSEMPLRGAWEAFGSRSMPRIEVLSVIASVVSRRLALEQRSGPAESDLDERGLCRCGCMSTVAVIRGVFVLLVAEGVTFRKDDPIAVDASGRAVPVGSPDAITGPAFTAVKDASGETVEAAIGPPTEDV